MRYLVLLLLFPVSAFAEEPLITLTPTELAEHDDLVAARAAANQLIGEAARRAQAVEAKINKAKEPAKPVGPARPAPRPDGSAP
jgi:hypothetical protein